MVYDQSAGYHEFWAQLLNKAGERTDLHARTRPGNDWWISTTRSGISL
jgi:hypothetical protein